MKFVYTVLATAAAVWVATAIPGVNLEGGSLAERIGTLIAVALLFGLVNAVIKPIVKIAGGMLYLLTLGLIGLVVNGLLFWLTGWLAGELTLPFEVTGFFPGLFGALIVSVVGTLLGIPGKLGAAAASRMRSQRR